MCVVCVCGGGGGAGRERGRAGACVRVSAGRDEKDVE